jgi:hypothetical protein
MARTADPQTQLRNQKLISYFREEMAKVGMPNGRRFAPRNSELAPMFGMSEQMVQLTLRQEGLVDRANRRQKQPFDEARPLSNFHKLIGSELERALHGLILRGEVQGGSVTELGAYLKIPAMQLGEIFRGLREPTLGQLMIMCHAAELQLHELIRTCQAKEKSYEHKSPGKLGPTAKILPPSKTFP